MNEFLKILLNIRSLRAACRDLSLEQLEEGLQKLSEVVAERQQDESAERQAREEHQKKIAEYAEMLKAAGIDPAELVGTVATESTKTSKGKRAPRPAKYRYLDNREFNFEVQFPIKNQAAFRSSSKTTCGCLNP
ncbi:H-NS family histone-like protein, partial [Aeromonas mytilicola]